MPTDTLSEMIDDYCQAMSCIQWFCYLDGEYLGSVYGPTQCDADLMVARRWPGQNVTIGGGVRMGIQDILKE